MSRSSINSEFEEFEDRIRKMIETKADSDKKLYDLANDRDGKGSYGAFQLNNIGSSRNVAIYGTGTGTIVGP